MVTNNQFGMGTALRRHSAVTDLQRKGESLGVPGMRCDGMDVLDTHAVLCEAVAPRARGAPAACWSRRSPTASAATRWPTPSSTAPRRRSPTGASATRSPRSASCSSAEGVVDEAERERIDERGDRARWTRPWQFADASPFPAPESLYDDVYVLERGGARLVLGARPPTRGRRRRARSAGWHTGTARSEIPQQMTERAAAGEDARMGGGAAWPTMRYREALNAALREELARDERVILMGEDIGVFGGAFKVTEGLLEEFGERRVRDTPISENTIVGVGVGAAMTGLRPVVELMTINFALLAFDQIVNHAAHIHYMFGGQVPRAAGRAHAPGRRPPARARRTRTAWRRCSCTCPACSSPRPPPPPTPRAC